MQKRSRNSLQPIIICRHQITPHSQRYPEAVIITIDDDRVYHPDFCELLWKEHLKSKHAIICPVARVYGRDNFDYNCLNYFNGAFLVELDAFGVFEGFAGVLYPPHALHLDVFNFDLFKMLTPYAYDIWFQIMALKNNIRFAPSKLSHRI